jgi:PAS domain S-box-containing protein
VASLIRDQAIAESLAIPGLLSVRPGMRTTPDGCELLLPSTWTDIESVLATGRPLNSPLSVPHVAELLEPGRGDHYEVVIGGSRAVPVVGTTLRLFQGRLRRNAESAFFALARELTSKLLDAEGLITVDVGRRMAEEGDEAIIVSLWQDDPQMAIAAGGDALQPMGDADIVSLFEPGFTVEQFDAVTLQPRFGTAPAMLLADDDRRYVYANPAAAHILGRSVARLLTMRVEDLAAQPLRDDLPRLWDEFLEVGEMQGPYEVELADGKQIKGRYSARARYPWRQTHLQVFTSNGNEDILDVDAALAANGLAKAS